jgi:putative serine protease PepD
MSVSNIPAAVAAGSPAEQAGLQAGDIITQVGDVTLDANHSYINALFKNQPGDEVTVGFVRNGRAFQVQVVLGEL